MRLMRIVLFACLPIWAQGAAANEDVYQVCTFESLPPVVMHYPQDGTPTMSVENRAPVRMSVGLGADRIASATIDGYSFQFQVRSASLAIVQNGTTLASQVGRCTRIGGPVNAERFAWQVDEADTPTPIMDEPDTGDWDIDISTSRFDDTDTVVLMLSSTETVPARFGSGRATPRLVLRCLENTTVMYIVINGSHLTDHQSYGQVDYRIDDAPPGVWRMSASTDNEALGLWNGGRSISQIRRLFGANRLDVRLTPFSESPVQFGFDVAGVETAIEPLRESCNW